MSEDQRYAYIDYNPDEDNICRIAKRTPASKSTYVPAYFMYTLFLYIINI
jgi:hypothetical protein